MFKSSPKFLLITILLLLGYQTSKATHVVGGDLTYKHIQKDSFEISLVLYIDCIFGNPQAIAQDAYAMVGVFDSSGNLIKTLFEPRSLPIRINSVNYNCVQPPSNACVDKYVYKYYTNLPHINGGYILSYQRCCRNNSITNIVNPGGNGATYWAYLPDTIQSMGYNSSAVFANVPPNFLCTNRSFIYNHNAIDIDGDSLVYELFTPYNGASVSNSLPRPPSAPPYYPVLWENTFNEFQMMKGNPELTIHPITGILNVTPQSVGQYVVGILVKEYRNGKLINISRRDFQFNVLICQFNLVSSFSENINTCSDTVIFSNNSIGATGYLWKFGVPNATNDTSTEYTPSYIYPFAGKYKVKLTVSNANCTDSSELMVTILRDTIRFAGNDATICLGDSVQIGTNDTNSFNYTWKPNLFLNNDKIKNPISTPTQNIQYIVTRSISALCNNTDTINITLNQPKANFKLSYQTNCQDVTIKLDSITTFSYMDWFLDRKLITKNELESKIFEKNKAYTVQLAINNGICNDTFTQQFFAQQSDSIVLIPNVFSPNNDNINDCFYIQGISLTWPCSQLFVYNRWGELVFDSKTDGICWNGTSNGKPLTSGVYFYILKHLGKNYNGTVLLTN